jgi:hypothetical protein
MSYLSQPTSTTDYGVVLVGDFINVTDGIISLEQDLSPNADVTFNNVSATNGSFSSNLTAAGNLVVTSVTPSNGAGISLSNVVSNGYAASFTVTNTGVLSLIAGSGISLTANTGNITISSFGADLINVLGVTGNYTATLTDEYIGVFSANAVTITLPAGVNGRVYYIKDEYGQGSGKITIQPQIGEKIDGKNTYIISVPNQSVNVVSRAGNWYII